VQLELKDAMHEELIERRSRSRPPLWSSGQFLATDPEVRVRYPALPDFLRGLERGPLSLASTIEELLERKSSGSGLENGKIQP
jgi:hypothetical protein